MNKLVQSGKYYISQKNAMHKYYEQNKRSLADKRMERYYKHKLESLIYLWLNDWNYTFRFRASGNPY